MNRWKVIEWAPSAKYALLRYVREIPGMPDVYLGCVEVKRNEVSAIVNTIGNELNAWNYEVPGHDPILAMSTVEFMAKLAMLPGKPDRL